MSLVTYMIINKKTKRNFATLLCNVITKVDIASQENLLVEK